MRKRGGLYFSPRTTDAELSSSSYPDLLVHGDTAVVAEGVPYVSADSVMVLVKVDLRTLEVDKSLHISAPQSSELNRVRLIHYDGATVHVLWDFADGRSQVQVLNAVTGAVIESHPSFTGDFFPPFDFYFVYDGSDYWLATNRPFDNRIARFDPSGSVVDPVHRNPVFASSGLAWSDGYFWVADEENDRLVKVQLEGL